MSGSRDRLRSALGLTALVAAAAASSRALGIYWGPGRLVHAPAAFFEESLRLGREDLPLNLWVDFRLVEGRRPDALAVHHRTGGLRPS